ncbi:LamG-like jellyroll fold domain-containing protein [Chitinophaga arvensicola]|uniref:Concanavalin A-like lectin/glucanases superfamily protein n=1 Tax=Chitinophaga arvensicola TaxID=29529 RepID=A0A1I0R860_9BACT|nr:LamG-like jellyroll fold domain-containing protein [Chitinophaga arvensicola]SEW36704.1 Concanavalin A-like lectin/glucanases superfamily protein [Chitinophaga arvensicola]
MIRHSLLRISAFLLLLAGSCNKPALFEHNVATDSLPPAIRKKVLVIAIEGARGQVVRDADIPNMKALLPNSIYSWDAVTDTATADAASWASLFTGVINYKNGVSGAAYTGNQFTAYPAFTQRFGERKLDITAISSSTSLNDTLLKGNTLVKTTGNDAATKDSAVGRLQHSDPDILVVALSSVHTAGVNNGFSDNADAYTTAIHQADAYIGEVLGAMRSRKNYASEDWLVIIASNHGGTDQGTYGGSSFAERNNFLLYYNRSFTGKMQEMPLLNVPYEGTFPFFYRKDGKDHAAYTKDEAFHFGDAQNFTIEFNIQTTYAGGDDHGIVSNKNWGSGGNIGWVIYKTSGNIRLNYRGASASRIDVRTGPPVADGKWHHITVTFDRQGVVNFYKDGKYFVSGPSIKGMGTVDAGLPFVVGTDGTLNYTDGSSGDNYIADIRVWNSVLPESVIYDWAFRPVTPLHPAYSSLIGYWKANEGPTGNIIRDYSRTGADLVISNGLQWDVKKDILNPSDVDATLLVPHSMDLAVNALAWMGVKMQQGWQLDGKTAIVQ